MPWKENCRVDRRYEMVLAVLKERASVARLCRQEGVSRKTAYKWLGRFLEDGCRGLVDQSRARKTHEDAIPDDVRKAVIAERKRHPSWGPKKLYAVLQRTNPELDLCSESSMSRILKKAGLATPQTSRRSPARNLSGPRVVPQGPNDLWTVDFKGQFLMLDRQLCYPLTIADAYSRCLLCVSAKASVKTDPVRASFELVFREHGLPLAVRSDNGAPFAGPGLGRLSRLSVWLLSLGICLDRIRPGRPTENGSHERMHRTLKAETARPPGRNLANQQAKFTRFMREYNEERPHEGIGLKVPAAMYERSPREYREASTQDEYPAHWQCRRVQRPGTIYWHKSPLFVSEPLAGRTVGLHEVDDGLWHLYFRTTLLGVLDERGEEPRVYDIMAARGECNLEGETRPLSPSRPSPHPPSSSGFPGVP